ncbi:unnamed protein product [Porites evermanni]|uniref:Uncharacterized protein n=1 Tax=Porites evermanni TaxID=104178 RepID=A0ABN8Q8T0_9CNID|nr:unnamed protein product [Porites evermanni]
MGWVGNDGADINWDVSPVSSPVTELSHRDEFNKAKLEAEFIDLSKKARAGLPKFPPKYCIPTPIAITLTCKETKTKKPKDNKFDELCSSGASILEVSNLTY